MNYRFERLNGEMQRALSQIIARLKDPRITGMVSVQQVTVAKDLKTAKVSLGIFGTQSEEETQATFEALCRCAGFIRKELAREFKDQRTTPELTFALDRSMEYSAHIEKLLEEIRKDAPSD